LQLGAGAGGFALGGDAGSGLGFAGLAAGGDALLGLDEARVGHDGGIRRG
jgi:hypothetical protein